MKVYHVYRTDRIGYDEFSFHIVVASSWEEAKSALTKEFHYAGGHPWADGEPRDSDIVYEELGGYTGPNKDPYVVNSAFCAG